MDQKIIDITYTVSRNQTNHLFFLSEKAIKSLDLPEEIIDEISSFGAEADNSLYKKSIEEVALLKLSEILTAFWDIRLGMPRFRFEGDTEKLSDAIKHRTVLVFAMFSGISIDESVQQYLEILPFCTKVAFISDKFVSTDHKSISTYLRQRKYELHQACVKSRSLNFDVRMRDWYSDIGLYEQLKEKATAAIENFVTAKKLDLFIPNFLVVPVYHIRRYQKATELIKEVYLPNFIMTLPIEVRGMTFTVLFPVSFRNQNKHSTIRI